MRAWVALVDAAVRRACGGWAVATRRAAPAGVVCGLLSVPGAEELGRSTGGAACAEHLVERDGCQVAAADQRDQLVEATQYCRMVGVPEIDHSRLQVLCCFGQQELS